MGPRLKISASKHAPCTPQNKWDYSITNHDDSGQVYTEFTCAGTSKTAHWKWKTRGSTQEHGCFRSQGCGSSSLYDMAIRSCLLSSFDITAESLEEVPELVGVALWNRIVAAQLDSVHLFLAFSKYYTVAISRKYYALPNPDLPLPFYLRGLTSLDGQCLTHLTLLHITIPRTALVQLSLVPNLAVLTVGPGVFATDVGVDDSLLRTWSRAASTGAFSQLRGLALRGQEHVTARAFEYLSVFPALSLLAIESASGIRRHDEAVAWTNGWKYRTDQHLLSDWLAVTKGSGVNKGTVKWDAFSHALFAFGGSFSEAKFTVTSVEAANALPTVHLALGGHPKDAVFDVATDNAMGVWYRRHSHMVDSRAATTESAQQPCQLPDWSSDHASTRKEPRGEPICTGKSVSASTSASQPEPQTQPQPQKRALSPQKNELAAQKTRKPRPVLRRSKMQDLDNSLLLGFGT